MFGPVAEKAVVLHGQKIVELLDGRPAGRLGVLEAALDVLEQHVAHLAPGSARGDGVELYKMCKCDLR